ncbi:HAD family hydrolase [Brevibacterium casei]|uniref:HAD family hydrolase n=1 Tax=Brevibacterium casei TaxID=33889 RepID=UPI00223C1C0F|nr:HAD family hydrolase [Brevibacterium casei]MCT1765155.1 HAD family hydrolase [Brevibacterium casei]MDH5147294.1 HAD family hydrolase [Brevibacterium casei]
MVFDVGETLVDETRHWTVLAEAAGVPPLTFFAVFGSLIERGEDHRRIWSELGVEKPQSELTVRPDDLYPDALLCLTAVRRAGFTVGIAGNQPAAAEAHLKEIGFDADLIASSERWGIEKPSADFFARIVDAMSVEAHAVLYVGDRVDNDIIPAREAGMRTAFLARGPWGTIHKRRPEARLADITVGSLAEFEALLH